MAVVVDLKGPEGNAFMIMGTVKGIMKQLGSKPDEIKEAMHDMRSGDFAHLLEVAEAACKGCLEFESYGAEYEED